jgi:SAM-dependent methyltransferase
VNTPHLRFLRHVREHELACALAHFPPAKNGLENTVVLEIGAGTGQQAQALSNKGYRVTAIDLASSHYRHERVYDVTEYDGQTIPLADHSVDVVFSSNVLEHVACIDDFLEEQQRVMKDGGVAIHILPSAACRLWGIPAHYVWLLRRVFALLFAKTIQTPSDSPAAQPPRKPQSAHDWLITLFPERHGERGTTLTEAYYYSRYWWNRKFRQHGFIPVRVESNGLFYTMANAFNDMLDLKWRSRMAKLFGSACHIYVLRRDRS